MAESILLGVIAGFVFVILIQVSRGVSLLTEIRDAVRRDQNHKLP